MFKNRQLQEFLHLPAGLAYLLPPFLEENAKEDGNVRPYIVQTTDILQGGEDEKVSGNADCDMHADRSFRCGVQQRQRAR
jgi:hypothetical protein